VLCGIKAAKTSAAVEFAVNLHHYGGARDGWDAAPASIRVIICLRC